MILMTLNLLLQNHLHRVSALVYLAHCLQVSMSSNYLDEHVVYADTQSLTMILLNPKNVEMVTEFSLKIEMQNYNLLSAKITSE